MPLLKIFLVLPVVLALAGCFIGSDYANTPPEKLAAKISVKDDVLDDVLRFKAPILFRGLSDSYRIRTTMDKQNGEAVHVIFVEDEFFTANRSGNNYEYPGGSASDAAFRNYTVARDAGGNLFDIVSGAKSFDGCSSSFCYYEEDFGIIIPDEYLESVAESGLLLRASSEAGVYMDFEISPNYIAGVLLRLQQERAKLGF